MNLFISDAWAQGDPAGGGLLGLGVTTTRAWRLRYDSEDHEGVTLLVMYWHFLDVVWLGLFVVLQVQASG